MWKFFRRNKKPAIPQTLEDVTAQLMRGTTHSLSSTQASPELLKYLDFLTAQPNPRTDLPAMLLENYREAAAKG